VLGCGHEAAAATTPLCPHLQECRTPWLSYVDWYTGRGLAKELLCKSCAEVRERGGQATVVSVCQYCYEYAVDDVGDQDGVRGKPGAVERPEAFDTTIRESYLPADVGAVADFAPVDGEGGSVWLLLTEQGVVGRFDADAGTWVRLAVTSVPDEPGHKPWVGHVLRRRLHVSADGNFAAIVNDYGQHGEVLDLGSGRRTMLLDGGDGHADTVPFSFGFIAHAGRVLAIHRTAWNRVDVSDAATGQLLTPREPTSYSRGEPRPPHYLDYFHGRLLVSPDGAHILDDGWVWQPYGLPVVWSLDAWLDSNVWESDDGPSLKTLCWRGYYWDHAMIWMDAKTVLVGGIGSDDDAMVDGVRVFDIELPHKSDRFSVAEMFAFAGPSGDFLCDGRWLYSTDETGTSVWDPNDGARTGRLAGFVGTRVHRGARELAEIRTGTMYRWHCPQSS
jgi:hypothetical protein